MVLKHEELLLATLGDDGMSMTTRQLSTGLGRGQVARTLLKMFGDDKVTFNVTSRGRCGRLRFKRYWRKA